MEEARPKCTTCLSFQLFYRKAFILRQFSKHSWSFHSKAFKERLKDYIDSKTQWVSNSFLISITYGWSFPCAISMIAIACKRGKKYNWFRQPWFMKYARRGFQRVRNLWLVFVLLNVPHWKQPIWFQVSNHILYTLPLILRDLWALLKGTEKQKVKWHYICFSVPNLRGLLPRAVSNHIWPWLY